MSENKTIEVGTRVSWTRTSSSGNSFNFKSLEGKVLGLNVGRTAAYVQEGNGRKEWISLDRLRDSSEKSELTEMVDEMAGHKIENKEDTTIPA
jgi:hypothetical protein